MNSATDTDSTADTRLKFHCNESKKNIITLKSWQETEKKRLSNILDYNLENWDIDDKGLQSITKLAAIICGMPMSFVTLVGEEKIKFLSRYGSEIPGAIRKHSFCEVAIKQREFFEVEDSLKDPRFEENEFVKNQETALRYYAAFPVISPQGYHFGSLCVCDIKANKINEIQKEALKVLSDEVMIHLELRKQNKELKEANERAEKLAKVKDEFVNNVSHELRTPLNAIGGYADILSKTDLDMDQKEAVSIIKGSCEILITLINDILDFSKIQLGKLQLENIPFDLRKTIKNVKDLLNPKAKEKNLKFELKVDENIPKFILGDKVRINQIIMNLTGNALKFTQEGYVNIDIKMIDENEKNINILFSVKDSGIGIEEDKLKTIFERFEQAGKDITRKFGGSGLGLNISKNLVELHNSKLEVKSEYGKGTNFFFIIQFDKFLDQSDSKCYVNKKVDNNYMEKISNIKDLKILVCEDNSVNIKLIKAIFKNKNINIEIAENGKIAIELLKKKVKNFDLILMDIQMPEMNGFETTKYIRNIMNLNIPIIGFSASTSEMERNYCIEVGMNDYILKSFGGNEIFDKLNNFVNKNKSYEEDFNQKLNDSELNRSIRGISDGHHNHSNKQISNTFKINKDCKKKFTINKFNLNIKNNYGIREIGINKQKNFSNCEKVSKFNFHSNSPLTENLDYKNSIIKSLESNRASCDSNQRSIFSQENPNLNKYNINFSSDVIRTSSKNSSENLKKDNLILKKINLSLQIKKNKENNLNGADCQLDNYTSNTEGELNYKNLNHSYSNSFNIKRYLTKKDLNRSIKLDLNENLEKSFNSEKNIESYNIYLKKCIKVGLKKKNSKVNFTNTPNNNNYKFSKFNENINTNKSDIQNDSKCLSAKQYEENNMNLVIDSSHLNFNADFIVEDKEKNQNLTQKNMDDLKLFENNENNYEIISNSSRTPPKIRESICNLNQEANKDNQEKKDKFSLGDKNAFSRKSSFSKLKENESIDFSQLSIKFENFDEHSENENEDIMEIHNDNTEVDYFEDDPEMRIELLELFMQENPKQLKSLKSAIISRNLDAIKFIVHTMKPSVMMFGLKNLYKKLEKIEVICKSISLNKIKTLYEEIKKDLQSFYSENNFCR